MGYTLNITGDYQSTLDIESFSLMMKDPSYCYKFCCWPRSAVSLPMRRKQRLKMPSAAITRS